VRALSPQLKRLGLKTLGVAPARGAQPIAPPPRPIGA